jgi:hypothetical protein
MGALGADFTGALLPFHLGWSAHHHRRSRYIFRYHCSSRHKGISANRYAIQHNCADPDHAAVFQGGAMHNSAMANSYLPTDAHRCIWITMHHCPILDIAVATHLDRAEISP